jgi:hypothetical protein
MSTSFDTLSCYFGALAGGLGSFPLDNAHYRASTDSLAAFNRNSEFGWGRYGLRRPSPSSALPPANSIPEAIPKYVSGRTSYLRACLAFHPYPQVIRAVFNPQRFGPPRPVTAASTCPRVDRHGFGSAASNVIALFRLAFATAPALKALTCC